jgi:hypothetical protein
MEMEEALSTADPEDGTAARREADVEDDPTTKEK